jgi:agmatine/peptidylarginine deiminase
MPNPVLRWPAEWEPQAAVLIAWPHDSTDWAARLEAVERSYVALATAVTRFQPLVVIVADADVRMRAETLLAGSADTSRIRFVELPYDDTWLRDSGPVVLKSETGHPAAARTQPVRRMSGLAFDESEDSSSAHPCAEGAPGFRLLDFRFTGWGGKFDATQDDALVDGLVRAGLFGAVEHRRIDWALEGGAIESDGRGSVLTTWRCLHQRHPEQSREAMDAMLRDSLAANRVLWLEHGYLEGDDTDAHIDTLARFAPGDAIVFQACARPKADRTRCIRCRGPGRSPTATAASPPPTPTTLSSTAPCSCPPTTTRPTMPPPPSSPPPIPAAKSCKSPAAR